MGNSKNRKSFSLRSVFQLRLRHFALAVVTIVTFSSCGGGGGGGGGGEGGPNQQPVASQADVIIATVSGDPDLLAVATDRYGQEAIGVSVEKDGTGKPTRLKAVHYFTSGIAGHLEIGSDDLPSVLSDQAGNKLVFTSYTDTTVDVTLIDYEGNHIIGPQTVPIDGAVLAEFRSTYATALQGNLTSQGLAASGKQVGKAVQVVSGSAYEDVALFENRKLWVRTAILGGSVVLCGAGLLAGAAAAVPTLGASFLLTAAGCINTAGAVISHISGKQNTASEVAFKATDIAICVLENDCFLLAVDSVVENAEQLDKQPPHVPPSGLESQTVTYRVVSIRWMEAVDYFGIANYRIYRDNGVIGDSQTTQFVDYNVQPGTRYCYQVQAIDVGGNSSEKSDSLCVTTTTVPRPIAVTGAVTNITSSSATLNGSVNPNGLATDIYFQYGISTFYQGETPRQPIGSGSTSVGVPPVTINGLVSGAIYHYRLVAINSEGSASGSVI